MIMQPGWRRISFGECVSLLSGGTPRKARSDFWGGTIPWVSSKDLKNDRIYTTDDLLTDAGAVNGTRVVPAGTILFVVRSMILANRFPVSIAMRPVAFNQDIKAIVCKDFVSPLFIYYWLRANEYEILGRVDEAGHGTKRLQIDRLAAMEMTVPPLDEQHRITGILSAYDDLIENCERRIRILDEMARALYREWFVSFRFPGHEKVKFVDSELGRIPEGWGIEPFGEIAAVQRGRSYRSADIGEEGGVPFINLKCIDRDGGFRRIGIRRFIGGSPESRSARPGDIVMAVTDMTQERRIVARAALVPTLDADFGVFSMDLVRIDPRPSYPKSWVYAYLRYSTFADHLKLQANGANVLHLSPDRISEHRMLIPPELLITQFAAHFTPMIEAQDVLQNRIDNLRQTRDLLLPRLLSGKLAVENAA